MSERILKALMQLFAIIAKVEVNEETGEINYDAGGRKIVQLFLRQELNQELVKEYLSLFDEFLQTHQGKSKKKAGKRKRTSVNSVKVLRICTQINEELTQRQKIIVLVRILEFIYASTSQPTEQEQEFVDTVAETFNIPKDEFERCSEFVGARAEDNIDSEHYLVIDNKQESNLQESRHIFSETLIGYLRVMRVNSINTYFVKYYGDHELYLNGQILTQDRIHTLTQGSSIRSSRVQPIYYSDIISKFLSDTSAKKVVFDVDNITYKFKGGNIGLHDFSFHEESGKLMGIMGGSGAGKSTLLNILNGNYTPTSGAVTINGIDLHQEKQNLEGVIGFVPQDDLLIEELTVFQNLFYNAKLCFGNYNDKQIASLCIKTLKAIGLYETKDLKVGSPLEKTISGGQRKRLNIALELIREPSVMFVDEPTSGLSSRDSENIMDLLKELALKGKLIFVVIHQPSSDIFKMFDRLIILDQGGFPIYNGNPVDAVIYFKRLVHHVNSEESECITCGNVNPEQIFNIIESKVVDEYGNLTTNRKVSPKEWNTHYRELLLEESPQRETKSAIPESIFKIPGKLTQTGIFFIRDLKSKLTNTQYMLITLFEAPALAGILAFFMKYLNTGIRGADEYVFYDSENVPQFIFISVIVSLFIGLTTSAEEIIGNLKILKREKFLNLSKGSYLFSKMTIMFIISAIQSLFYVLVGNVILGIDGMIFPYWFALFSTSCFANLLGLNISASFNSVKVIYILIPILIIPQLLFSGIIVQFDKLNPLFASKSHVPWIGNVMASRWAYEAMSVNQFKNNEYEKNFFEYDKEMSFSNWKKDHWASNLENKLKDIKRFKASGEEDIDKLNQALTNIDILKHEIEKEMRLVDLECSPEALAKLTYETFDDFVYDELIAYFEMLRHRYKLIYNAFEAKKDSVQQTFLKPSPPFMEKIDGMKENGEITRKEHKKLRKFMTRLKDKSFQNFRSHYKNKALEDFVKNANTLAFTDEDGNEIIQKRDPIYLDPYDSNYLSAQFYAPRKKIFGVYIDTFSANMLVIWFMSFLLIFTLYTDTLKRFLDFIAKVPGYLPKLKK